MQQSGYYNTPEIFQHIQRLRNGGGYQKKGLFGNLNPRKVGLFKRNINPQKVSSQLIEKPNIEIADNEQYFVFAVHRPFGDRACRLSFRLDKRWNRGSQQRKDMPHFSMSKGQRPLILNFRTIDFSGIKNKIRKEEDKRRLRLLNEEGRLYKSKFEVRFVLVTTDLELFKRYERNHHLYKVYYFNLAEPNRVQTAIDHAIRLHHENRFTFKDTEAERIRKLIAQRREQREADIKELKEAALKEEVDKELTEATQQTQKAAQETLLEAYAVAEAKDKELEASLYPSIEQLWLDHSELQPMHPALLNFLLIADFLGREIHPSTANNERFFLY